MTLPKSYVEINENRGIAYKKKKERNRENEWKKYTGEIKSITPKYEK